ncbi:MAG: putative sulfate exporter family transporter [Planctomycetota bacterium]|nr:putative sulfate exporter family transporter [Planctomycetota bacterium]
MSSTLKARLSWVPGVLVATALAAVALQLAALPLFKEQLHFGALLLVILLGMLWRLVLPLPTWAIPGIEMAKKPILRWAVAGLGLRLTIGEILDIGGTALLIVSVSTLAALAAGWWLAKKFDIPRDLGLLLGVGGAICGASAVVAADTVVQARKQDSAMAIGVITILGTIGILLFPELGWMIGLNNFDFGVWAGASLQETAQVVAAGDTYSPESKEVATVVKLVRICWLAPIVFYLGRQVAKRAKAESPDAPDKSVPLVPWFLVMFGVFAVIRSMELVPESGTFSLTNCKTVVKWMMCIGMAGVGLQTSILDLAKTGLRPIIVGALQWVVLGVVALTLIKLL